ncbi:MAG TPA: hypothetical protein VF604_03980 [Pyrinomonadaceae bacterium]|jgi:hypothetical protein
MKPPVSIKKFYTAALLVSLFSVAGCTKVQTTREIVAVIPACASRNYFAEPLRKTSAKPLLWTTNLMAPEAYILHDALEGWTRGESEAQIRTRAAQAYGKYQKISLKSARNLLVTGW